MKIIVITFVSVTVGSLHPLRKLTSSQMKTTLHTDDTAKDWYDAVCLQQNRFVGLRALSNEERVKEADVSDVLSVATVAPGPRSRLSVAS